MKNKRLIPLQYFVDLIIFDAFKNRINIFYEFGRTGNLNEIPREELGFGGFRFDEEKELISYTIGGHMGGEMLHDFKETLKVDLKSNVEENLRFLYVELNSGTLFEQNQLCLRLDNTLDKLFYTVRESQIFNKYPSVLESLVEIKNFIDEYKSPIIGLVKAEEKAIVQPVQQLALCYRQHVSGQRLTTHNSSEKYSIGILFDSLKEIGLIGSETALATFRNIFSGKPILNRIRWTGTNAQIRLFIHSIQSSLVRNAGEKLSNKWQTTCACFCNRDGEDFTVQSLKSVGVVENKIPQYLAIKSLGKILKN